ncbi:hypothetical protein [Fredinandcohnia onubensis]|uniref:hypothetical protein n=1 Tax=Fredinandcohnia onubensis TaxID=1571209 RepID=UPI000C0C0838|nr:hypothetical protein [Fredinandcohnia onubensis]
MKKILKGIKFIAVLILLISLLTPLQTVSASSLEKTILPTVMEKDYKEMMSVIRKNVINGESEESIAKLPEVEQFKKKYSEEQINLYLTSKVEGFKTKEFNGKINTSDEEKIEIGANGSAVIDYPDGSFAVVKSTTELDNDNLITPMASYNGAPGSSWTSTYEKEFWGVYLAARAVLVTKYTVYQSSINITDTADSGSKGVFPTSLTLRGTSIVTDNATTVQSKGSYQKVNGVVIGGQPIGYSHAFTLRTTIKRTAYTSSKVYFSVTNTYEG